METFSLVSFDIPVHSNIPKKRERERERESTTWANKEIQKILDDCFTPRLIRIRNSKHSEKVKKFIVSRTHYLLIQRVVFGSIESDPDDYLDSVL